VEHELGNCSICERVLAGQKRWYGPRSRSSSSKEEFFKVMNEGGKLIALEKKEWLAVPKV